MSVHASLNDLLRQFKKDPISTDLGSSIPLNSTWWSVAKELLTIGELREKLLGDKGASQREELQYISSPMFMSYQQILSQRQSQAQQQQEAAQQQEAQEKQMQLSGENSQTPQAPIRP